MTARSCAVDAPEPPGPSSPDGVAAWVFDRPQRCGLGVHLGHGGVRAAQHLRQRVGGVVTRNQQQPVEQLARGVGADRFDADAVALHLGVGDIGDDGGVQVQLVQGHQRQQHLDGARGRDGPRPGRERPAPDRCRGRPRSRSAPGRRGSAPSRPVARRRRPGDGGAVAAPKVAVTVSSAAMLAMSLRMGAQFNVRGPVLNRSMLSLAEISAARRFNSCWSTTPPLIDQRRFDDLDKVFTRIPSRPRLSQRGAAPDLGTSSMKASEGDSGSSMRCRYA